MRRLIATVATVATLAGCTLTPAPSISRHHDDYTGTTMTTAGPFPVTMGESWALVHGERETGETAYLFEFSRNGALAKRSSRWKYLQNHHLYLLIDGDRYNMGEGNHDGTINRTANGKPSISEKVTYEAPGGMVVALEDAEMLKGRIGGTEFSASPQNMELVREFIKDTQ